MLEKHQELKDAAKTNQLIDFVKQNEEIDDDIKHVIW